MILNSNASYPDSKSSAYLELRFFRPFMYRSTSLMTYFSFANNLFAVVAPVQFLVVGSFVVFWKIHSSESRALIRQRIPEIDSCCHSFEHESPRDLLCRRLLKSCWGIISSLSTRRKTQVTFWAWRSGRESR